MIALFLKKYWSYILDSLIVVAVILAFTFWDPFGIFNTAKIRQTATLVTGIREIGELVTAEYYGEVISSWKEFKLTQYPTDTLSGFARKYYNELKNRIGVLKGKNQINDEI